MSVWTRAMVAAMKAVAAPTVATTVIAVAERLKSGASRATMYTPAVTMVAAWISAETGVGPSMASGSQTWRGIWALLPQAPTKSSRQITVVGPNVHRASAGCVIAASMVDAKSTLP